MIGIHLHLSTEYNKINTFSRPACTLKSTFLTRLKVMGLIALPIIAYIGYNLFFRKFPCPCIDPPLGWHQICQSEGLKENVLNKCDPNRWKKFKHIINRLWGEPTCSTKIYEANKAYLWSWGGCIGLKETQDWKTICYDGSKSFPNNCCKTDLWKSIVYEQNSMNQWTTSVFTENKKLICKWDTIVNGDFPLFNYAPPPPLPEPKIVEWFDRCECVKVTFPDFDTQDFLIKKI